MLSGSLVVVEYTYWGVAVDCRVKSWKEADYNYKLRSKIVEDVKRHHKFLEVPEREGNWWTTGTVTPRKEAGWVVLLGAVAN